MTSIVKLQSMREARGQHNSTNSQTHELPPRYPSQTTATVLLFTGVRYERMAEPRPPCNLALDVTARDVLVLAD